MKTIALSALFLFLSHPLFGESNIVAEFSFKKRPPTVGLLYLKDSKKAGSTIVVDQKDQNFSQKIYVGSKDTKITLKNSDAIDHNIFANDKNLGIKFDIGLAKPGMIYQQDLTWSDGHVVKIGCMIHPKMKAYLASVNSSHFQPIEFAKKEKSKTIEFKALPDTATTVKLWLPKYEVVTIDLATLPTTVKLMRKGKEKGVVTVKKK